MSDADTARVSMADGSPFAGEYELRHFDGFRREEGDRLYRVYAEGQGWFSHQSIRDSTARFIELPAVAGGKSRTYLGFVGEHHTQICEIQTNPGRGASFSLLVVTDAKGDLTTLAASYGLRLRDDGVLEESDGRRPTSAHLKDLFSDPRVNDALSNPTRGLAFRKK